jgi:hypothetical protein
VQDDQIVTRSTVVPSVISVAEPRSIAAQLAAVAERISPLRLGMVQGLFAFVLATLMLSVPARQPGFQGIVNNVNGPRSWRRVTMWNGELGWLSDHLTRFGISPDTFMWLVRGMHFALALVQAIAIIALVVQLTRGNIGPVWRWFFGPALTAGILMIYPPLCADVFYYITSGAIANSGGNPYEWPLGHYYDAPLLYLNDWAHISSPYGPLWTLICQGVVALFGSHFLAAVFGFKLLGFASIFVFVWLVYKLAYKLMGDQKLAIAVAVACSWMPTLLFEPTTGAHNDALMFNLALGGLLVMTMRKRGTTRLGLLLIALSALLKYVTLPLLLFALLWRLADQRPGESRRKLIGAWAIDAVAICALIVVAYAPYWVGPKTLSSLLAQPTRGVSSSLWIIPHNLTKTFFGVPAAKSFDNVLGYVTLGFLLPLFVATFFWLGRQMWKLHGSDGLADSGPTRDRRLLLMMQAWMIPAGLLPFIPVDTHNWYAIWSIAPFFILLAWLWKRQTAAKSGESVERLPRLVAWLNPVALLAIYLSWSLFNLLIYHTRTF